MDDIIRAVKTNIVFGNESLDAYKLENYLFEKRFGVTGVSRTFGYSKQWFNTFTKRASERLKALREKGFTGSQIRVRVPRDDSKRGSSVAKTISIRDFNKMLAYEAIEEKNLKAIVLLVAVAERGLENLINDAFDGVSLDWFAEKIVHYSQWTYPELEEVLQYNREECRTLYPWHGYDLTGQKNPNSRSRQLPCSLN